MADIQYLNYGDQQIEQQALLNNLANNVQNYVQNQSWSKKRKDKFMSAYSDLMNRGIIGASNSTGQWMIDVNGDPLPEMSKKDKEMYQEAAYFIQQQMASLPTKQAEEEKKEEEKAKLDVFNNEYFINGFNTKLANDWFGGASFSRANDWNTLDERGENGLRGFKNRADRLAQSLQNYIDSLDENKLNFEGSAFKNLGDFKTKVGTAIQMLRTDPANAKDALNAIGLKFSDYLYNGAEDASGYQDKEGNPLTYQQVANVQQKAQEEADILKAKEAAIAQQQQANANKGILNQIGGIHGTDARNNPQGYAEYISGKLGVGQQGFNAMNNLVQGLLNKAYSTGKLDSNEKKQLGNLLYYIREKNPNYQGLGTGKNTNVTLEEFEELKKFQSFGENNIKNMVRLPWQTSDGRYTYADSKGNVYFLKPTNQKKFNAPAINRSKQYYDYKNNFLSNTKKGMDKQQENYLKSIGFNDADIAELTGIGLDIASIVDPEPITAGLFGVGAAGARNYARTRDPKNWTFGDYATQTFDYITGAIGAIPGLGDLALASKTAANVAKWGKRIMTIPAVWDMASHTPGATEAIKKAINGKDLTVEDWRNLGSFVRGLTATRNIAVQNRAARRAMEKRGYDISSQNGILKRSGLWDTSIPKTQTTVKVNVKGKQEEIQISSESKSKLDKELKKAGNNQTKKDEAIRNVKEVKEHISNQKLKEKDITAIESSTFRNAKYIPRQLGTTKANYGRTEVNKPSGNDTFEAYLNGNRGVWDRLKYGSNRTLRAFDPAKGISLSTGSQSQPKSNPVSTTSNNDYVPENIDNVTKSLLNNMKGSKQKMGRETRIPTPKNSTVNGKLIDGSTYQIQYGGPKSGEMVIVYKGTPFKVKGNLHSQKKRIGQWIERQNKQIASSLTSKIKVDDPKWQAYVESIKDLKRKGYLFKQGGTIDKQRIQRYKEYITK